MSFSLQVGLPNGVLRIRTNSAECFDYLRARCAQMVVGTAAEHACVSADIICLKDATLPWVAPAECVGKWPDARDGEFLSFSDEHVLCAWRPPSLMGAAVLRGSVRLRVVLTAVNPSLCECPPGGLRLKCGDIGLPYTDALDLTCCLFARLRDVTLLHGAVVEKDGNGVLIVGESGAGKTTASLALLRSGYRLLSDEYAVLWKTGGRRGKLSGLLVPAMIVGPGLGSLGELEKTLDEPSPSKAAFTVKGDASNHEPVAVKAVIALARPEKRETFHQSSPPLDPLEVMPVLLSQLLDPVRAGRMGVVDALLDMMRGASAYRAVIGSDLAALPAFVERLIRGDVCGVREER